jgi:hypothetical protein
MNMLDFNKLAPQIAGLESASFAERAEHQEALLGALEALENASADSHAFVEKLCRNSETVLWPLSLPLQDLTMKRDCPDFTGEVIVIGVDGSQIMPSHHEVHACYLLNIGVAVISYNSSHKTVLESRPTLFHRQDDIYPLVDRRRLHIDELYVSLERNILELQTLAELSVAHQAKGLDVVALVDGSLIPWSVEKLSDRYKSSFLERMKDALEVFRAYRIPLIGYLSNSRAADVVNTLRVSICPYEQSDCKRHCGDLNEEDFPCSRIWPLPDRLLYAKNLGDGQCSASFASAASVAKSFTYDHNICFAYMNVSSEVARLEFPRWLQATPDLFDFALSVVRAQVRKGMGYPVCLAEAHNQAVIRGADRDRFFQLMTNQMVELGFSRVSVSPKEIRKRRGFV